MYTDIGLDTRSILHVLLPCGKFVGWTRFRQSEFLKEAILSGRRKQDPLNPQKYRYVKPFDDLAEDNTHIIAIVLFRFSEGPGGEPVSNNYIVTAYQKEIG